MLIGTEQRIDKANHSKLAPLNLLASWSPSDLGDMERGDGVAEECNRRFPSGGYG